MKPECVEITTALDRLSTWDEIRRATSLTPDRIFEGCYTKGSHCEVESEYGGRVRIPAEEFEFFAFLSEIHDSRAN